MTFLIRSFRALALVGTMAVSMAYADAEDSTKEGGLTGTGIVGEVTALGSIQINGHWVKFPDNLAVTSSLGQKQAGDLVPGDVVAVAVTSGKEGWEAHAMTQIHALIGPVSDVSETGFVVLGTQVSAAEIDQSFRVGDWVAVQGFWSRDGLRATRITTTPQRRFASLQGSYSEPVSGGKGFRVGSTQFDIEPLQNARPGDVLRVSGFVEDDLLKVTDIHVGLFDVPVGIVLAEGYFSDVAPSGHYTVNGSGLSSYTDNPGQIMPEARVRVCGVAGKMLHALEDLSASERAQLDQLGCNSSQGVSP